MPDVRLDNYITIYCVLHRISFVLFAILYKIYIPARYFGTKKAAPEGPVLYGRVRSAAAYIS